MEFWCQSILRHTKRLTGHKDRMMGHSNNRQKLLWLNDLGFDSFQDTEEYGYIAVLDVAAKKVKSWIIYTNFDILNKERGEAVLAGTIVAVTEELAQEGLLGESMIPDAFYEKMNQGRVAMRIAA